MNDSFKSVIDNLLDVFSQGNLAPIALKVADKYNDDAIAIKIDISNTDGQTALFASSDKVFIDNFAPDDDYSAITDEVALNIVEGFNN